MVYLLSNIMRIEDLVTAVDSVNYFIYSKKNILKKSLRRVTFLL